MVLKKEKSIKGNFINLTTFWGAFYVHWIPVLTFVEDICAPRYCGDFSLFFILDGFCTLRVKFNGTHHA